MPGGLAVLVLDVQPELRGGTPRRCWTRGSCPAPRPGAPPGSRCRSHPTPSMQRASAQNGCITRCGGGASVSSPGTSSTRRMSPPKPMHASPSLLGHRERPPPTAEADRGDLVLVVDQRHARAVIPGVGLLGVVVHGRRGCRPAARGHRGPGQGDHVLLDGRGPSSDPSRQTLGLEAQHGALQPCVRISAVRLPANRHRCPAPSCAARRTSASAKDSVQCWMAERFMGRRVILRFTAYT